MATQQNLTQDEQFWGPKYGSIYPYLEDATPYKKLLKQIEEYLDPKPGERWLDLGTGSGAMVDLIWNKSKGQIKEIVALDLTDVMLEHLRRRIPSLVPEPSEHHITLVKHNLSKRLPFPDNSFDGVTASLVLTYIQEHEGKKGIDALAALFNEVHRVLAPAGAFVWTTPKYRVNFARVFAASWREILNPRKYYNLFYGPAILRYALKIQKKGKKGEYQFLPKARFLELLAEAGFLETKTAYSFAGQALVLASTKK
ncbi:MAG: class I SAM-dependent methyltransferase [Parcubacteria group bacterium]|nr:class I SAM-dependent methyltransferase [Parcubacteria group bacterium]